MAAAGIDSGDGCMTSGALHGGAGAVREAHDTLKITTQTSARQTAAEVASTGGGGGLIMAQDHDGQPGK